MNRKRLDLIVARLGLGLLLTPLACSTGSDSMGADLPGEGTGTDGDAEADGAGTNGDDDAAEADTSGGDVETGGSDTTEGADADTGVQGETGGDTDATGETGGDTDPDTGAIPGVCGDGMLDPGELCDDGGESPLCNADCTPAVCGDGILNATAGEECDAAVANGACSPACLASCNVGYDDCNADPASDGCETELGTDTACTGCGDACIGVDSCFPIGCAQLDNYYNDEFLGAFGEFDNRLFGYSINFSDDAYVTSLSFMSHTQGGTNARLALYDASLNLVIETGPSGAYSGNGPTAHELPVSEQVVPAGAYWVVGLFDDGSQLTVSPQLNFPNILAVAHDYDDGFPATITNAAFINYFAPNIWVTAAVQ